MSRNHRDEDQFGRKARNGHKLRQQSSRSSAIAESIELGEEA